MAAQQPRGPRSNLPSDDEALAALAAAGDAAFGTPPKPGAGRPLAAVPPAPTAAAATALPVPGPAPAPADVADDHARIAAQDGRDAAGAEPATGGTDDFITQSTVQLDLGVARRFRRYQERDKPRPSNAEVVFRAVEAARGRHAEIIDARRPKLPEGRSLGRAVPGRRPPGTRLPTQINFRPTVGEKADIQRLGTEAGAQSMSEFVNAMLDEFLPK
jgi:hypothetical protein